MRHREEIPKLDVAGSIPVARSNPHRGLRRTPWPPMRMPDSPTGTRSQSQPVDEPLVRSLPKMLSSARRHSTVQARAAEPEQSSPQLARGHTVDEAVGQAGRRGMARGHCREGGVARPCSMA